ncbi:MAG TPA: vWA domain-containing protein [Gaiellaceae bacterium]|nr:vWA domain-containing protein [Gaiellaceae bacterium]
MRADAPIPVADSTLLGGAARRTRVIRIVFAVVLVAAVVAAFLVAPRHPGRRYLPAQAVGIVVLDVSSSVRPSTYYRIEQALDSIAGSKGRLGLVLFSDTAYEALPPGTPASDLQPFLRFFAPPGSGSSQTYLAGSPWQQWFSAGTRISQGLFLAQHMLDREKAKKGAILLISDLADDPNDQDAAKQAVIDLEQKGIPVEIVGLDPSMQNANFWKRLLGAQAVYQTATLPTGEQAAGKIKVTNGFSFALFLFAALAVLVLAVNEWWAEPFRFQRRAA